MKKEMERIIAEYETAAAKIIIYCVEELPFPLGAEKVTAVLRGAKSSFVLKYELYSLSSFSVLSMHSREQIKHIINVLVGENLLYVETKQLYNNMPVLRVSKNGKAFLEDLYSGKVGFLDKFIDRDVPAFKAEDISLFNKLKLLRHSIASRMGIPVFAICGDIVLREITKHKPRDTGSMLAVKGIGEKFVDKYGSEFIDTIEMHYKLCETNV